MPIVRYMTPEEEEEYPEQSGIADEEFIAARKGYPPKSIGRTIRHELGHIKYPVEITFGPVEEPTNWEEFHVKDLFRELGACYYALKLVPRDPETKRLIKKEKRYARGEGLTTRIISRIDKIARDRVGYSGKEVI